MTDEQRLADLLADRVWALMGELRLTQRGLARRAGVDERSIRRVLDGHGCTIAMLEKIALALHTEAAKILRPAA